MLNLKIFSRDIDQFTEIIPLCQIPSPVNEFWIRTIQRILYECLFRIHWIIIVSISQASPSYADFANFMSIYQFITFILDSRIT